MEEFRQATRVLMERGIFITVPNDTDGGNYTILTDMIEVERHIARLVDGNAEAQEGRAADPTDLQYQKCNFCGRMEMCVQVSVTTGGDPGLFSVGEEYWICYSCGARPIRDLVDRAFADRDARTELPSSPKSTSSPKRQERTTE